MADVIENYLSPSGNSQERDYDTKEAKRTNKHGEADLYMHRRGSNQVSHFVFALERQDQIRVPGVNTRTGGLTEGDTIQT